MFLRGTAEASAPATAWRGQGFDDSGWQSGATPIGYREHERCLRHADNDIALYVLGRSSCEGGFEVADPAMVKELRCGSSGDGFIL